MVEEGAVLCSDSAFSVWRERPAHQLNNATASDTATSHAHPLNARVAASNEKIPASALAQGLSTQRARCAHLP